MEVESTQNNNNVTNDANAAAFEEFGVMPEIIKAIQELGWALPRDIQAECIPLILGGGDVMAAAETGSGKTGAFSLPLLQIVYETRREIAQPKAWNQHQSIKMNFDDRSAVIAMDSDGLTVQNNTEQWGGVRSNIGITKGNCSNIVSYVPGQYYYEVIIQHGGCRVGWATKAGSLDLGTDTHGFGFGFTGKKSFAKRFDPYGETYTDGDAIGCYLDLENNQVSFSKNGKNLGVAFEIPANMRKNFSFYPCVCLKEGQVLLNFGATPFKYQPEAAFKALQQADATHIAQTTGAVSKKGRTPLALIMEPTRELAIQTDEAVASFKKYLPDPQIDQACLVGGINDVAVAKDIANGVDIVTATPGKIIDYVNSGRIDLSTIRFFVLDEADHLIDHNKADIMQIWNMIPKSQLQVLMFSATLHSASVKELGEKLCKFPTWVDLKGKDSVPDTVDHAFVWANPQDQKSLITAQPKIATDGVHHRDNLRSNSLTPEVSSEYVKLIKPHLLLKIISAYKMDQAMIFCRTKVDCDNLEAFMQSLNPAKKGPMIDTEYSCCVVHSDRRADERNANITAFKSGEVRFLICTDVAARGIDINQLPYVINYTLPDLPETYIHRIGRVGRADKMGLAISIVSSVKEKVWYHTCPSKGKSCNNSNLKEKGGCAVWYDEPTYWQDIQKRLGITVPHLDSNYRLAQSDGTQYGQAKKGGEEAVFLTHINELQPLVTLLSEMEDSAQLTYWSIKSKFSKK